MLILIIVLLAVVIALGFAAFFVMKFVLVVAAVIIYGGCFVLFATLLGSTNTEVAILVSAVAGTLIFLVLAKCLGESDGDDMEKNCVPVLDLLTFSIIKRWANNQKKGVVLHLQKHVSTRGLWSRLRTKEVPIGIAATLTNGEEKVIATCDWRAYRFSADLNNMFGTNDSCKIIIDGKLGKSESNFAPLRNVDLDSVQNWIRSKASKFLR